MNALNKLITIVQYLTTTNIIELPDFFKVISPSYDSYNISYNCYSLNIQFNKKYKDNSFTSLAGHYFILRLSTEPEYINYTGKYKIPKTDDELFQFKLSNNCPVLNTLLETRTNKSAEIQITKNSIDTFYNIIRELI